MRLVETLFNSHGYNPLIRPVENLSEIVTIKFGLAMIQLINVVRILIVLTVGTIHQKGLKIIFLNVKRGKVASVMHCNLRPPRLASRSGLEI